MKSFELQDHFGIDSLKLVDRPEPKLRPGEVLIAMRAWSLNYRDLLMVKGQYNPKLPLPLTPLSDGAGEVVAVGDGVARVVPGDRVACNFMPKWVEGPLTDEKARSALGGMVPGTLAEFVALNAEGVVRVPAHLTDEEAATLPCAAVTAWNAVVEGGTKPGDCVLVLGTGGVSLFALQFARLCGARVIATSGSNDKLKRVIELGASDAINYHSTPQWGQRVRELTGGRGVDLVVEVGGAGTLGESLRAVRTGGQVSLIGVLAGASEFNPVPILMKGIRLQGIHVGSRVMFESMNEAMAYGNVKPVVDRVYAFEELRDALRHMERGAHFGKIVLRKAQ